MDIDMEIYNILKELNIEYEEIEHKAVYTIEEVLGTDIQSRIDGVECKNLFVKNKNHFYLIFLECNKRANLKEISHQMGESNLRFASEEELKHILNLGLGSVTPLGIFNDKDNKVTLLLDKELKASKVLVHPNVNPKTLSLKFEDLVKIIKYTKHRYFMI